MSDTRQPRSLEERMREVLEAAGARLDQRDPRFGGDISKHPRVVRQAMEALVRDERFRGEKETALKVIDEWFAGKVKDDGELSLEEWDQFYYSIAEEIEEPAALEESRPKLDRKRALYGLVGDTVRMIEDHTEADPVGLLMQSLVVFGSVAGRNAYYRVTARKHFPNLFIVLVGTSARGRKGQAWSDVRYVLDPIENYWFENCVQNGLSSGEGLIKHLARAQDKRLLADETEFGRILKAIDRESNILSMVLRRAWDSDDLSTMTKDAERAVNPHLSIVGHVTPQELRKLLNDTEVASGFANRFLWPLVRRVRLLPFGGDLCNVNFDDLRARWKAAIEFAKFRGLARPGESSPPIAMDREAREYWKLLYKKHSIGQPGMMGAITSRGDPQTCRLALIYALMDLSADIKLKHLEAAAAVWEYCEASARFIFGDHTGDPVVDAIFRKLRDAEHGLTRTQINDAFGGNQSAKEIQSALKTLHMQGLAHPEKKDTGGRPRELWFAGEALAGADVRKKGEKG